jgi:YlmC/YmxH family sporulation protein
LRPCVGRRARKRCGAALKKRKNGQRAEKRNAAMTFRELCKKEVVQLEQGACLGKIDDLTIDPDTAAVRELIMLGRPRLFGLLGREEGLTIPWEEVEKIGVDAILIRTALPHRGETEQQEAKGGGFWAGLFGGKHSGTD